MYVHDQIGDYLFHKNNLIYEFTSCKTGNSVLQKFSLFLICSLEHLVYMELKPNYISFLNKRPPHKNFIHVVKAVCYLL